MARAICEGFALQGNYEEGGEADGEDSGSSIRPHKAALLCLVHLPIISLGRLANAVSGAMFVLDRLLHLSGYAAMWLVITGTPED